MHFFCMDLPHSDAIFVKAYLDGGISRWTCGGVSVVRSILYDNTTLAVAKIGADGMRKRTRAFSELVSHYLFEDRFGRPGKGNDKARLKTWWGLPAVSFWCRSRVWGPSGS